MRKTATCSPGDGLPPSSKVRLTSALAVLGNASIASIDYKQMMIFIKQHLLSSSSPNVRELLTDYSLRHQSPILFDTVDDEINFTCLQAMLAFGSGYRIDLHQLTGYGAANTMLFGLLGLHMDDAYPHLDASTMVQLTRDQIAALFHLPLEEEYEIQPAITGFRPSAITPLVDEIYHAFHTTGERLLQLNKKDFAQYIRDTLRICYELYNQQQQQQQPPSDSTPAFSTTQPPPIHIYGVSDYLIAHLIRDFPHTFDDTATILTPISNDPTLSQYAHLQGILEQCRLIQQQCHGVASTSQSLSAPTPAVTATTPAVHENRQPLETQEEEKKIEYDAVDHDDGEELLGIEEPKPAALDTPDISASDPLLAFEDGIQTPSIYDIPVCIYKKVQLLCSELYSKFAQRDSLFQFPEGTTPITLASLPGGSQPENISPQETSDEKPIIPSALPNLTIFADNVIPAMLLQLGILRLPQRVQHTIAQSKQISSSSAALLRVLSIVACDLITTIVNSLWVEEHDGTSTTAGLESRLDEVITFLDCVTQQHSVNSDRNDDDTLDFERTSNEDAKDEGVQDDNEDHEDTETTPCEKKYTYEELHAVIMSYYLDYLFVDKYGMTVSQSVYHGHVASESAHQSLIHAITPLFTSSPSSNNHDPVNTVNNKNQQSMMFTASLLDYYFYAIIGKKDENRQIPRHIQKKTPFY